VNDQELEIVRQNLARLEDGGRERRQELQGLFKRDDKLWDAIWLAKRVSWASLIPAVMVTLYFGYFSGSNSLLALIVAPVGIVVVWGVAPFVSAGAANYWFYDSPIPLRRATIVMLLTIHAMFTMWLFVFCSRMKS
jgi:hypothetical protein